MNEFDIRFKQRLAQIDFHAALNFALGVSKKLLPDYILFSETKGWGDPRVHLDAIAFCEGIQESDLDQQRLKDLMSGIDSATPETDDFESFLSSYALNAACTVLEMLEYVNDRQLNHIHNIASYYTDTIDFKIQENNKDLELSKVENHPKMREAQKWLRNLAG